MEISEAQIQKQTFPVTGMTCAACASSVETILQYTDGVKSASVNFATNTVQVEFDDSTNPDALNKALEDIGYGLIISDKEVSESVKEEQEKKYEAVKKQTIGAALLAFPVFILGMFFMDWEPGRWISLVLSIPVLFYFGSHFYTNAWKQAKHRKANMDTLVALSTGIAFIFSAFNTIFPDFWHIRGIHPHVYYEAATVIIVFISFGKVLEERAKFSTGTALRKLMGLQPKTLTLIREGKPQEIKIEEVALGDRILIKPGEKIPVDGKVLEGSSFIDESMISGEPVPVEKSVSAEVFAGTINQKGSLQIEAVKVGASTLLSQIIKRVQEAQGSKAPVQKLVDKIAGIFVPIVILIALLTFGVWMVVGGENAFSHALLASVSVLVIACPCALGLATPTAIMVGVGKGAENQILIRDAESLELGHRVNALILDKTGTITEGKPTVVSMQWTDSVSSEQSQFIVGNGQDVSGKHLVVSSIGDHHLPLTTYYLQILHSLESKSEHPLAEAVVKYLKEKEIEGVNIEDFQSVTGRGVKGNFEGKSYFVGNENLLKENRIAITPELESRAKEWSKEAQTVIWFADETQALAILGIRDQIKASSKSAILKLQNSGIEVFMLTGDNRQTATAVAHEVGIRDFRAEVMPSDKSQFVKNLQEKGRIVAMVGDGINDSEALAQADVSIAMGHGSDIAMDVAKITLITSDLEKIPQAFRLSHLTVNGIKQNLFWAFIYNLIGIPIAAGVLYPINGFLLDPMIASAAMAFSSVSVVLNSLRLKSRNL
ncbi:MAG: heavy metal translocating P-type ATPase [Algoriphagus sp.]|uniref:heavy metal translocating P-type ATPase n=1 Tax=Algoriphagus sp. TaxID=1872435 RepID=UPI00272F9A07|nr:heavy metal translocating P-type ATPase [Algoriphagus sp.]MDP2040418.1 heavy metal translocating P-type ATPase [Algoriphagus sp.]MDP3471894.1 heavy metal translocating P-type ATPase [Algoriphagus sp.]